MASLLSSVACRQRGDNFADLEELEQSPVGQVVAVTFGPDGRLWRLIPGDEHVYVDYSTNRGQSFYPAVAVNNLPQTIQARADDRPSIQVDRAGRILVLYFAAGPLPWSSYFSYSGDDGQHFSPPALVSDHALSALHYQDVMKLDPQGNSYIVWHDQRENADPSQRLSALYYTAFHDPGALSFPNRRITGALCACCRVALDFEATGQPAIFARRVYPDGIRDHALLTRATHDGTWNIRRISFDKWQSADCPAPGPALAIAANGRYHLVWSGRDKAGPGLFYAYSDDRGAHLSKIARVAPLTAERSQAELLVLEQRVILAWKEIARGTSQVMAMQSEDGGQHWSKPEVLLSSIAASDQPQLLRYHDAAFLSWNSEDYGHRVVALR